MDLRPLGVFLERLGPGTDDTPPSSSCITNDGISANGLLMFAPVP